MAGEQRLIGIREVARRLGISKRTVERFVERGTIKKPIRVGRQIRWIEAEIDEWIRQGCPGGFWDQMTWWK